jgi:hypothetical protein
VPSITTAGLPVWEDGGANGRPLLTIGDLSVLSLAWAPGGATLAAGTDYGQLLMWNAASGGLVHRLESGSSVLD